MSDLSRKDGDLTRETLGDSTRTKFGALTRKDGDLDLSRKDGDLSRTDRW